MGGQRKMVDSGVEWIGGIPDDWGITRVGSYFDVDAGIPAPADAEPMRPGLVPFVRVSDLSRAKGKTISETRDGIQGRCRKYPAGTIIFPKSGESIRTGVRKVLAGNQAVVGHLACLIPVNDSGYGYWISESLDFEEDTNQTSLPSLNLVAISRKPIPLPLHPEQRAIAAYLDHHVSLIDRERELITQKIDLLKDKRRAMIYEAVTGKLRVDGGGGSVRMVDSGVEWIGEVPEEWGVLPLKNAASIHLGKMLTPHQTSSAQIETPYLRAANITGSSDEIQSMWATEREVCSNRVQKGDVLVVEGGSVGFPLHANGEIPHNLIIQNSVHRVRFFGNQRYGFWWMLFLYECGIYSQVINSVSIAHLTKEKIERVAALSPPLHEQQSIASHLDRQVGIVDQEIALLLQKNELLSDQRKALIFEAVTGKLDITP